MTTRPRVRSLSIHARYRCANAGACCSSGWDIPVEPPAEDGLRRAMAAGELPAGALWPSPGLPHGARAVLARDAQGRCAFLEPGPRSRCAVHARLGEDALPSACRQFPRVATLSPLGVSVTLSHYCPTAAALLFEADPVRIVEGPPAFEATWPFEGLDAREALPPLLRPGVLAGWAALERWEEHAAAVLDDASAAPDEAVARLAAAAERARAWTPQRGSFEVFFERALAGDAPPGGVGAALALDPLRAWDLVASTVPAGPQRPARPSARPSVPALPAGAQRPIRRWLAAKAFGSWLALQGEGLRTTALGLAVSLAVLHAELLRGAPEEEAEFNRERLSGAVRRADLLLVHLSDPQALARRLSACEKARASSVLASLLRP